MGHTLYRHACLLKRGVAALVRSGSRYSACDIGMLAGKKFNQPPLQISHRSPHWSWLLIGRCGHMIGAIKEKKGLLTRNGV
jgi:hypothetical protein